MAWLRRIGLGLVALALGVLAAGQLGALRGTMPADLGLREGRLKPPSSTANSVSTQADLWPGHPQRAYARIAPLPAPGDGAAAMARLAEVVRRQPGATIVEQRPGYLRAEFETRWLRFVDDAEFALDPAAGVIHVRSASRLGRSDLGVNRARIEAIRAALAAPG